MNSTQPPRRLWVVRHGERADDANPLWHLTATRPHDPPLTAEGIRQAESTAEALRRKCHQQPIEAVYTSPFLRCLETAAAIASALQLPLKVEPGLSEWLSQNLVGECHPVDAAMAEQAAEVATRMNVQIDLTYAPLWDHAPRRAFLEAQGAWFLPKATKFAPLPFPETQDQVVQRYVATLQVLRERDRFRGAVFVSHAICVQAAAQSSGAPAVAKVDYCAVATVVERLHGMRKDTRGWQYEPCAACGGAVCACLSVGRGEEAAAVAFSGLLISGRDQEVGSGEPPISTTEADVVHHTPLARVLDIQQECLADDLPATESMTCWSEAEVLAYYESGGTFEPAGRPLVRRVRPVLS